MKRYHCKHTVEAMRWTDTDENREAFAAWFESHDVIFETRGPVVMLPDDCGEVSEGEWILYSHDEFIAMEHEAFVAEYAEVTPDAGILRANRDAIVAALSPCAHSSRREGDDLPRRYGSFRSEVCDDCGAFRATSHVPPYEEQYGWRPADEYEAATAPLELD